MNNTKRVAWLEGMFLRHQHFQQQERSIEKRLSQISQYLHNYPWGVRTITFDQQHLALGRLLVKQCDGIFSDGTLFDSTADSILPEAIEVPEDTRDSVVYLGLPLSKGSERTLAPTADEGEFVRFTQQDTQVADDSSKQRAQTNIQVAALQLQFLFDDDDLSQYAVIPIAKIRERHKDGLLTLDETFVPTVLNIHGASTLTQSVNELLSSLTHRINMLQSHVSSSGSGSMSNIELLMLLELLNGTKPKLKHLASSTQTHPETLYLLLIEFAGKLTTYAGRQTLDDIPYHHNEMARTFSPLFTTIRRLLANIIAQNAIQLTLQTTKQGIRVCLFDDPVTQNNRGLILAVKAPIGQDELLKRVPAQFKVGPIEKIQELVKLQLLGITLKPLAVTPPQIPYHTGFIYFEIDAGNALYQDFKTSKGLACYIGGDFPSLELELWAVQ